MSFSLYEFKIFEYLNFCKLQFYSGFLHSMQMCVSFKNTRVNFILCEFEVFESSIFRQLQF